MSTPLQITKEEAENWERFKRKANKCSEQNKGIFRGGKKRGHKKKQYIKEQQPKRKTKYRSKQIEQDICRADNTWLKTLTRLQYNDKTNNISLQSGLSFRKNTITFSNLITEVA